ncbi:MAG TPA: Mur ligase domain-containing protein [Candidatus Saccharimonadales bacterium]|nr:Mur ligase domain-containing protein [Candidatus Saccharimonadales bacterium]
MHIYFSGLGGVAIGPLALIARDSGYEVSGSDMATSRWTQLMEAEGIHVNIGQDGSQIAAAHKYRPIDWLVISSAVPAEHPEVQFARDHHIPVTKRANMLKKILADKHLKLIAISGTHGKTTTTAMMVWLFTRFQLPVSYSIGSHVSFGPSGAYQANSEYFVYECDEYDRNMLEFHPFMSLITSVDYDHADIYPTRQVYDQAFLQFATQSQSVLFWQSDATRLKPSHSRITILDDDDAHLQHIHLAGRHNRQNAWQAASAFAQLFPQYALEDVLAKLSDFPGSDRRFEKLADNIYTSYDHHPTEIRAALQLASELNDHVIAVYQPHQNSRQHEFANEYADCFIQAEHLYWLPTYLSREDPNLPVLSPQELIAHLSNPDIAEPAEMTDELAAILQQAAADGKLVLCMGAGDIDAWARSHFAQATGAKNPDE